MDRKKGTMDHTLLILVVILIVFGLTVLLSTSAYNGQVKFSDPASYFKKQFFCYHFRRCCHVCGGGNGLP